MAGIRVFLGLFPKTSVYENQRIRLEEDYNELLTLKNSKELHKYHELDEYLKSEEFAHKKNDILKLRFKHTEAFQKEKQYKSLAKSKDIRLFNNTKDSDDLKRFLKIEKSDTLKKYLELHEFVNSQQFASAKKEASVSKKEKFKRSDLSKTLENYRTQKASPKIIGYKKFVKSKLFTDFVAAIDEGLPQKIEELAKLDKKSDEYKQLLKSKRYNRYKKHAGSLGKKYYDELHGTDQLEAYEDLAKFIESEDFKRQKKEIESKTFKDTEEYLRWEEYQNYLNSDDIKFYLKYKKSKALSNYQKLLGSERIKNFDELGSYISSDEFLRFKNYATDSPKKRWQDSKEYDKEKEFEDLKNSDKIKWYFKNVKSKRFEWHKHWELTFSDDFSSKSLDKTNWMTRYYYGEKMLKDSYSLSSDKHFVTDGKNVDIENEKLIISTRKEDVKGKSWHPSMGFIERNFGYTSGLVSTGQSFRQMYGIFEVKIRISESLDLQNAVWMVGKTIVPHINILKAGKKLSVGNSWGNPQDWKNIKGFSKSFKRSKFAEDYYIYSLEWTPKKLIWKINGLEVAASSQGIPNEPMYLSISSGLQKDVNAILPSRMEVDWVKCFQQKDTV